MVRWFSFFPWNVCAVLFLTHWSPTVHSNVVHDMYAPVMFEHTVRIYRGTSVNSKETRRNATTFVRLDETRAPRTKESSMIADVGRCWWLALRTINDAATSTIPSWDNVHQERRSDCDPTRSNVDPAVRGRRCCPGQCHAAVNRIARRRPYDCTRGGGGGRRR